MFDHFYFEKEEINSHALIPLFRSGSVNSDPASWDDCDRMFPDKLRACCLHEQLPHGQLLDWHDSDFSRLCGTVYMWQLLQFHFLYHIGQDWNYFSMDCLIRDFTLMSMGRVWNLDFDFSHLWGTVPVWQVLYSHLLQGLESVANHIVSCVASSSDKTGLNLQLFWEAIHQEKDGCGQCVILWVKRA